MPVYVHVIDHPDGRVLVEMMRRISGHEPKMWNVGTIGFDTYPYKYDSGREDDGHIIGFIQEKVKSPLP